MAEFFDVGSMVVYDVYGVCTVKEIKLMSFSKNQKKERYYVLSPINSASSTYYVPVENEKLSEKLRLPLNCSQIDALLDRVTDCELTWTDSRQERAELYRRILDNGISPELISLIKCLYERKQQLQQNGKSLAATDESVFSAAEKLIREEFAFSLGIDSDGVTEYIKNYLEAEAQC